MSAQQFLVLPKLGAGTSDLRPHFFRNSGIDVGTCRNIGFSGEVREHQVPHLGFVVLTWCFVLFLHLIWWTHLDAFAGITGILR